MARKEDPNDRTHVQAHDPLVGQTFDRRFHIDFRIAVGGFGAIYHATHKSSGHQFALKILHPRLANDPGVVARFQREGETLTRLRNDHTIIAYEMGEADDGTLFIVLELLQGESLYERFRDRGPFSWKELARIARGVCSSLEEAHGFGIVHRDLKPTNINLERKDGRDDFVKVLDFGIAKILHESDMDSADLTNAGQMIGTLDYMSPEQMVGGACTGQTDIYTLGIVMYEMISGRRPFAEAASPAAVLSAMLRTQPPPLTKLVPVPDGMNYIVMRCLERDIQQRWPDVILLGAALDTVLRGEDPRLQIASSTPRGDATETVPFDLGDDSTVFEPRPRSTKPFPAELVEPPTARTPGGAVQTRAALGEAPTVPVPHVQAPSRATPTPITNPKGPPSSPAVPPILFGPSAPAPAKPSKSGSMPPFAPNAPTVVTPTAPAHAATVVPRTPAPGSIAAPNAPTVVSRTPVPGSIGQRPRVLTPTHPTPIPTTPIPVAAPFRSSNASAPPMGVLAPPGPYVPLPHAPERPVMNPAAMMPGAPVAPIHHHGSAPVPMAMPGAGYPQSGPHFDMARIAARDAAMRRIVWIVVLALGGIIGIALAVRL